MLRTLIIGLLAQLSVLADVLAFLLGVTQWMR